MPTARLPCHADRTTAMPCRLHNCNANAIAMPTAQLQCHADCQHNYNADCTTAMPTQLQCNANTTAMQC
eukprot:5440779-Amphidinium_carterae.3